jgi:hypothetical protein
MDVRGFAADILLYISWVDHKAGLEVSCHFLKPNLHPKLNIDDK